MRDRRTAVQSGTAARSGGRVAIRLLLIRKGSEPMGLGTILVVIGEIIDLLEDEDES